MKEKILAIATRRFSENGFSSTSMQTIAEECGISKATLYKVYHSKEDLLIEVFEHLLDQMFRRATTIRFDDQLTKKERLRKKILLELEANKEYRAFINLVFNALPVQENSRIMMIMKKSRAALRDWHRECLLEAYGEKVTWDLVMLFQGTLKEYVILLEDEQKKISREKIADNILFFLDQSTEQLEQQCGALTDEIIMTYNENPHGRLFLTYEEQLEVLVKQIKEKVRRLDVTAEQLLEFEQVLQEISKEMKLANPAGFRVEAFCLFIQQHADIEAEKNELLRLTRSRT